MSDNFIFQGTLRDLDPAVADLIAREDQRQREAIILIASESESPAAVHEAIASPFAHIYAEGYPREASRKQTEAQILDVEYELAYYRRNSDPRYYKGVEYADVLEALTRRRAAELFAANGVSADNLYVNVQTLSGGPANNAIYTALVKPGDTVMGLKLSDGGHLSHGAPVNRSGILHQIVSYTVNTETGKLDYEAIAALALKHRPKMIIAGYSAYPLVIDWQRFRTIADSVGAYLIADIAHISGLVAAGVHPSPIGIADVVSTTTHKSLCGPRGAMLMTHRKDLSDLLDRAVFPGEQGGPHLNTIAALAVALRLAATDQFRALQQRIVENAQRLAEQLEARGIRVSSGRSENHLVLVDCRSIRVDGVPLTGDIASRILDVAGIVVNRNNVPGDKSAINPFGIRLGTVWVSQRGFGSAEIDRLAEAIAIVFHGCTPYYLRSETGGKQFFAKVDPLALAKARAMVHALTGAAPAIDPKALAVMVRGARAQQLLAVACAGDVAALESADAAVMALNGPDFAALPLVERRGADLFYLHCDSAEEAAAVRQWIADLSDGYVLAGPLHATLPGPVVAQQVTAQRPAANRALPAAFAAPFFVLNGEDGAESADSLPSFTWEAPANPDLKRTRLWERHKQMGAKLVPFGGWDMPVWYSSVSEEHAAVRQAAGLFDVSHMGVLEASGPHAAAFLNQVTANDVHALKVGQSHYSFLFDPDGHVIDDLLIYRTGTDRYMLVVNASNNDQDWAWLNAVNEGHVRIDSERPWVRLTAPALLRDLRDPAHGADCRVDLALQGPRSREILLALQPDPALAQRIQKMFWGGVAHGTLGDFDVIVSRTGYTGERVAFELFVHPDRVVAFWDALLAAGQPFGLLPCGLASRDSTRTEAGLPLHGHEMAGRYAINPVEAGFGKFVKITKPAFIGRSAAVQHALDPQRTIVRFRMDEKGVRRPEHGDPIVDKRGKVVGVVTSCAIDSEGWLLGQALVPLEWRKPGTVLTLYQTGGGNRPIPGATNVALGARVPLPATATVLPRFP
jgi:glycine hydroxymethyltransferase